MYHVINYQVDVLIFYWMEQNHMLWNLLSFHGFPQNNAPFTGAEQLVHFGCISKLQIIYIDAYVESFWFSGKWII